MVSLSTEFNGFTPSQMDLVQHWNACRHGLCLPKREDLDPGAIRAHLASISIVEIEPQGQVRFRLAGSGLRDILGREMRGRCVEELDQTVSEMWSLGLSSALEQLRPVGGMIERDEDCHAWLRLPLHAPMKQALVLCHDMLVPKERMRQNLTAQSHTASGTERTLAA
nr:PAS domain-containing protein [Hyphomonas sp. Mor2]